MENYQEECWDALCECSGECVANAFTNYFGLQILSKEFHDFLIDEGILFAKYCDGSDNDDE